MNRTLENVRTIWQRLGVQNAVTATEADIVSFEQKYDVTLSAIVRDYFTLLNGTAGGRLGMDDENLVGFWHIDEVRPLEEECPKYATAKNPNLFIFADYSIWAHAYALRLTKGRDSTAAVFFIGGNHPLQIAPTFEDFLRKYAAHDESILFSEDQLAAALVDRRVVVPPHYEAAQHDDVADNWRTSGFRLTNGYARAVCG